MRQCPKCGHLNDDDSGFCVVDGSPLAASGGQRIVVEIEEPEQQTRFATPKPVPPVHIRSQSSGLLYGLVGASIAAVSLMLGYVLLKPPGGDRSAYVAASNSSSSPLPGSNGISNSDPTRAGQRTDSYMANTVANAANSVANAVNSPAVTAEPVPTVGGDGTQKFDRIYSGRLDDNSVRMSLQRNGTYISGRVFPASSDADIYVEGSVQRDGSFSMDETSDIGVATGTYRGRFNSDGTMTGTWSKPDGGSTRSIFLRRQ